MFGIIKELPSFPRCGISLTPLSPSKVPPPKQRTAWSKGTGSGPHQTQSITRRERSWGQRDAILTNGILAHTEVRGPQGPHEAWFNNLNPLAGHLPYRFESTLGIG